MFDGLPAGKLPPLYVALGEELVRDASDATGLGAWHVFTITVVTTNSGFAQAKTAAAAIADALSDADMTLTRGQLISLRFIKARAAWVKKGDVRHIKMTFRARVAYDSE